MNDTPPDEFTAPEEQPAAADDDEAEGPDEPGSEPRRHARWLVALLVVGLVVVPAAVGVVGTRIIGVWGESDPESAPEATASPGPTEPPSLFEGTPAENFAEGAAGIVLPEAEAVGDFTADEVADALEQVRAALIAARLEHAMLVEHDPDPFVGLLAADQQPTVDAAFEAEEFGAFATQVAPDQTLLAVPRVEGVISYETTTDGGLPVLEVSTSFVWVYAFDSTGGDRVGQLVVIRDELDWWIRFHELWLESSRGLWMPSTASHVWGADCESYENGLLRPDGGTAGGPGEQADADMIFDPEQSLDSGDGC